VSESHAAGMNARRSSRCRSAWGAVLAAGLLAWGASPAQEIPGYPNSVGAFDPREVALLPKYCTYTQLFRSAVPGGNDAAKINAWTAYMGEIFHHMHHYCFGLMKTNRAILLSRDQTTRKYYLNDAISEFDYVIERAPRDFVLLPEIATKKAENLVRLERGPLAVLEFERAIELKPDYWPPYAYLSDYFKSAGDAKRAREYLEQGLAKVPDEKALQRRLAELDAPASARKGAKRSTTP
jgi:tetratricopeptide (TPR) repeat protein